MNAREQFRLERVARMTDVSDRLLPFVEDALASGDTAEALREPLRGIFEEEFAAADQRFGLFNTPQAAFGWFWDRVEPAIALAKGTSSTRRIADWLGTAVVNGARVAAADQSQKLWLSKRDTKVRPMHVEADGQVRGWSEPFTVCGGVEMMFPGDPVGDPSCWIQCRCVAAPASMFASDTFAKHDLIWYENRRTPEVVREGQPGEKGGAGTAAGKVMKRRRATEAEEKIISNGGWLRVDRDGRKPGNSGYMDRKSGIRPQFDASEEEMADDDTIDVEGVDDDLEDIIPFTIPWHGVLAVEGEPTGDGRRFAEGALQWDELPLHLRWQERDTGGHDGAVVVGSVDDVWREGNLVLGSGWFSDSEIADRAVGALLDGDVRGVSVDADSAELASEEGEGTVFATLRLRAATLVHVPAFRDAYVALGDGGSERSMLAAITDDPWDGSASRFTPEQWMRSCIVHIDDTSNKADHKLPIREPDGTLNRNAVHNAAARIGQVDAAPAEIGAARKRLAAAYREMGEEPPESLTASADFARGPGWVTDPAATRRIHDYWVRGEGAAKIRWGTPGDFRRLRRHLAKYINPLYLNRTVAKWHHDATGTWPGQCNKPGNPPCGKHRVGSLAGDGTVTAAALKELPHAWFADPGFDGPTPLTVIDGRIIQGHLATWGVCHVGIAGKCTTAPASKNGYASFRTGAVLTDKGMVSVGHITLGTGHAGLDADAYTAASHYDNTGTVVADVAAGEDDYGIWVAGAIRDGITDQQLHALQAGALSGDWRGIDGNLELVAALVVNVPGFPVPRPALAASAATGISPVTSNRQRVAVVASLMNVERVAKITAALRGR